MKRWFDLALFALMFGATYLAITRLPEPARQPRPSARELEIPRPRAAADAERIPRVPRPPPVEPPRGETPAPDVRVVPPVGRWILEGRSYRGGEEPCIGPLPLVAPAGGLPAADPQGRFVIDGAVGSLVWRDLPDGPALALSGGGGNGIIAVHQYPVANGPCDLLRPIAAAVIQPDGVPPRLFILGRADLPDGAEIAVRLLAAGYSLESALFRITGGTFAGELALTPREFHAGVYILQFAWGPLLATQEVRSRTQAQLETLRDRDCLRDGEYQRDVGVFLGTAAEARRQEAEIRTFYQAALDDLEGSRDILQVAGARARRKRPKFLDDPARVARIREHSLARAADAAFDGRKLSIPEWRKLIDEAVPARVALYSPVEKIPYRLKHPQAAHNLAYLAEQLRKYSRLESTIVYEALGLPQDPRDFDPSNDFSTPETEREQTLVRLENFAVSVREALGL